MFCNLLIFTYKDTNSWRDYQLLQAFSYPELAYSYAIRLFVAKCSGTDPCNLSVPMYTTEPLRNNQKYIYSDLKLRVHKIRKYVQYSDLYTILYQRLTNVFLKGALLPCKRASFTPQKSIFYHAKGHLLPCQSPSAIFNLWIFITTLLMPLFLS